MKFKILEKGRDGIAYRPERVCTYACSPCRRRSNRVDTDSRSRTGSWHSLRVCDTSAGLNDTRLRLKYRS